MQLFSLNNKQVVTLHIPNNFSKIAINLSGGADSAILLWLLIKYIDENKREDISILILTCANDRKHRWNANYSTKIIDFIIETTKTSQIQSHLVYYRDKQDVKYFHQIQDNLIKNKIANFFISGLTANPPSSVPHLQDGRVEKRDLKYGPHKDIIKDKGCAWYTPFINIDKMWIADQYQNFNLIDSLFPLTRSCEAVMPKGLDKNEYYNKPCKDCWWCKERKWAFNKY